MPPARREPASRSLLRASHQGGNIVIEVSDDGARPEPRQDPRQGASAGLPVSDTMSDARGLAADLRARLLHRRSGDRRLRPRRRHGRGEAQHHGDGRHASTSLDAGQRHHASPSACRSRWRSSTACRSRWERKSTSCRWATSSNRCNRPRWTSRTVAGQGKVVKVREEYLPLIPLYQIFAIEPRFEDPSQGIIVILESDGKKAALLVDEPGRAAAGRGQEPGIEFPQGGRHLRRHDPGRRRGFPDSRRVRPVALKPPAQRRPHFLLRPD